MSERHWMPLYVADYLADTGHLTTEEHGAYLLLMMHYWQHERLPDDDDRLARIARLPIKRWLSMRPAIRSYFDEGWIHQRVEREIQEAKDKFERLSRAGKKGGRPRKNEKRLESEAFERLSQNEKRLESYSQPQSQDLWSMPIHEEETPDEVDRYEAGGPFTVLRGGAA